MEIARLSGEAQSNELILCMLYILCFSYLILSNKTHLKMDRIDPIRLLLYQQYI